MIRVHTFGGLSVRDGDGKPLTGPATQPRRMAILALLARAGERGMSRDKVLALLWPDADGERGSKALAQAIYALRKDLSTEDIISGTKELRLDPAVVASDVTEFASAISRGDDARAVALYAGPFLDGFHLPAADGFSRWAERERTALGHEYIRSLESLARAALARGEAPQAVAWWRKVAALEPLNARFTTGLMEALVAAGDRAGAIKQAHVYQLLVDQELDLPPDKEVTALADRLRSITDGVPAPVKAPTSVSTEAAPTPTITRAPRDSAGPLAMTASRRLMQVRGVAVLIGVIVVALLAALRARRARVDDPTSATSATTATIIAVGEIASYGSDSAARLLAGPVADLLSTSLARVSGLHVVSRGRLLELIRAAQASGTTADTSAGGFVNAARRAAATQVIDGTVYARPGGRLRLDLRRVDLASGAISDVHTVEGDDLFALVDSGTARLVSALGVRGPVGSVADVTTRSATAYRMYEQGVRAYYRGDGPTALLFLRGALAEDSLFAFATYQSALAAVGTEPESVMTRLDRAKRLAARAPDRERLTILAGWAQAVSSPTLQALADTLVIRYPAEVEGHLYTGIARISGGDFLAAIAPLERVVAMDSLGVRGVGPSCRSCEALRWVVSAYELADSFPAAERAARRWVGLQPGSIPATNALTEVLDALGRTAEADSTFHTTAYADLAADDVLPFRAMHLIRAGEYDVADRLLVAETNRPGAARQMEAYWQLAVSLREQGRLAEALSATRRIRPLTRAAEHRGGSMGTNVLEAQLQLEQNHPAIAAALFDSIAAHSSRDVLPSQIAFGSPWMLTHAANARAAMRDTAMLVRLADSVRVLGAGSGYARDQRLFHHIRGLMLVARGNDASAISEFQSAIYSRTGGYSRTSLELASLLLRQRRPRDAIAVLQPALRGPLDAANLYVNRIELQDLLAKAWDAVQARDSAAAHYAVVARAWSAGDPPFRARADSARIRLAALRSR